MLALRGRSGTWSRTRPSKLHRPALVRSESTFLNPAGTANCESSTGFVEKSVISVFVSSREPGAPEFSAWAGGASCLGSLFFLPRPKRPPKPPSAPARLGRSACCCCGADACPPFVVGVGIGGNFEVSCLLSKKALVRSIAQPNADLFYAGLEKDLLIRINRLNVRPQGLGGDTTALAVLIETAPCHIASLPVAVNIECHSHRHGATES